MTDISAISNMTREELDVELAKGIKSAETGKCLTPEELDTELQNRFGI